MVSRALDDRIGYFSIHYQDVGDHRRNPNITSAHPHLADRVDTRVKVCVYVLGCVCGCRAFVFPRAQRVSLTP